jgi:hypothetical protein
MAMPFKRLPLLTQCTLLAFLVAAIGAVASLLLLGRAYIVNAESRARLVADLVEEGGGLGGHLKNATVAGRAPSAVYRMRAEGLANDGSRDPATPFERASIARLRESGRSEMSAVSGDRLVYARRVIAAASCMACHDAPAAPGVRTRIDGPGLKAGEMAGIVSVEVPLVDGGGRVDAVGALSWSAFAVVIACLAAMLWIVHRVVVTPVQRVSRATARAGEAGIAAVHTSALRYSAADAASRNEVHQLGVAVKRLLRSLKAREPGREQVSKEGADEGAHVT